MRVARQLALSESERQRIQTALGSPALRGNLRRRYLVLQMADQGKQDIEIARLLGVTRQTIARWRHRYLEAGLASVEHVPAGPGRKPRYPESSLQKALEMLDQRQGNGRTPSFHTIARETGVSVSSALRLWRKRIASHSAQVSAGAVPG